jgi:dihydrofolate reductase
MIILIAAVARNGCIGTNGQLPWHLPEDMARFKALTTGGVILMGRKTWESLPERFRPLPNRTNLVITRQESYAVPDGVEVYASMDDAMATHADDSVIVMGGAQIYAQAMDHADRMYITHVDRDVDGDAFFPEIHAETWEAVEREDRDGFAFVTYERRP